jgi:ElaB/YqjD/DUF883 family membrane-anchored ribosome-binding protein
LAISEVLLDPIAELVGALLGVFLGYLLGFRQQRKLESERNQKERKELMQALKAELLYLVGEVTRKSSSPSAFFGSLNFDTIFLDLPTFTSIVNSGQLLLLDSNIVHSLRELNGEVHEHNIAQSVFAGVVASADSSEAAGSNTQELKMILQNPQMEATSRLGGLLKLIVKKRKNIAQKAQELIGDLSR